MTNASFNSTNTFFDSLKTLESILYHTTQSQKKANLLAGIKPTSEEFQKSVIEKLKEVIDEPAKKRLKKNVYEYMHKADEDLSKIVNKIIEQEKEYVARDGEELKVQFNLVYVLGTPINVNDREKIIKNSNPDISDEVVGNWFDKLVDFGSGWLPKNLTGSKGRVRAIKNIKKTLAFPVYRVKIPLEDGKFKTELELQDILRKHPEYLPKGYDHFEYDKFMMLGNSIDFIYPKYYTKKRLLEITTRFKQNISSSKKFARSVSKINSKLPNDGVGLNLVVHGPNMASFTKSLIGLLKKYEIKHSVDYRFHTKDRDSSKKLTLGNIDESKIISYDRQMLRSMFDLIAKPNAFLKNTYSSKTSEAYVNELIQGIWLDFKTPNGVAMEAQLKTEVGQVVYEDGPLSHRSKDYLIRRTIDIADYLKKKGKYLIADYISDVIFNAFKSASGEIKSLKSKFFVILDKN